ncbi:N-acetyl-gamma-glutamyl-phosphate reductase [Acidocella sp.]|uniref:N-acetyl-gamma-glutamyl-phosphate reductase n=1 Tax=Acidocella sp. TaxID=50710 RepID=UPI003D067526
MSSRIFIDGQAGTTGLGIAQRLEAAGAFTLVTLPESHRKDREARAEAMSRADLTVLCLPDDAAREAVSIAPQGARILDASTAHRVAEGWVYGFAEALPGQAEKIAAAARVANPGCYATGAIALLRPLTALGLLAAETPLSVNAISGYSGGGKSMIAAHEASGGPAFELYALGLKHKHLPEVVRYAGLDRAPIFVPSVGHFAQGMLVCVPLHLEQLAKAGSAAHLAEAYADYYAGAETISVQRGIWGANLDPRALNNTDRLEIFVCANEAAGQVVLISRLDNLGKGASGAAVQNINLMLGLAA